MVLIAGSLSAQTPRAGDPNWVQEDDWSIGWPTVLTVSAQDVTHDFGTQPVSIPFSLQGSSATVWLALYTFDAEPQYGGASHGRGGVGNAVLRATGMDTLVFVGEMGKFSEGDHALVWDGRDWWGSPVEPGDYTFYLFALDSDSDPTWVAPPPYPSVWTNVILDPRFDPPQWWIPSYLDPQSGEDPLLFHSQYGADLFGDTPYYPWFEGYRVNAEAYAALKLPWMIPRRKELDPEYETNLWEIKFIEADPRDPDVLYIGNYTSPAGLWRVLFDRDALTITPDESWPGGARGFVPWEQRLFASALAQAFHHPWVKDDGLIYISWMDRDEPMTPGVLMLDRASGEVVNLLDLSHVYLGESDPAPRTPGPSEIDVDESGIYTTGYWVSVNSLPTKLTYDGEILWQNGPGDGFIDRFTDAELEHLGLRSEEQPINTHIQVSRWGITYTGGYNDTWHDEDGNVCICRPLINPIRGVVFGPDGSGLFKLRLQKTPDWTLGGGMYVIDNDTNYDGLHFASDAGVLHYPFDVTRGEIRHDVATAVVQRAGEETPDEFGLHGNFPNPFNAETVIAFSVPAGPADRVRIEVFDAAGQLVVTLVHEVLSAGTYQVPWDGRSERGDIVASGVYVYRMRAGDFATTQRLTFLK